MDTFLASAVDIGTKIVGAFVLWIVGRWAIGFAEKLLNASMVRQKVDPTLIRYTVSASVVLMNVLLVLAILSVFGIETTTFAGLLAAGGIAIGMAWSGLLSNFAAGVFMLILRPFKVGDFVTAGGITGTVKEIGLFVTAIDQMDNVRTYLGNNAVFSGTILNFTANPYRRVELTAQMPHGQSVENTIARLKERLAQIPNVTTDPAPQVEVLTFTLAGPVLAVRPFCHNDHDWDVYFATNDSIVEVFTALGFPPPEQHYRVAGNAVPVPKAA